MTNEDFDFDKRNLFAVKYPLFNKETEKNVYRTNI